MKRLRGVALCLLVVLVCGTSWVVGAEESEDALCIPLGEITLEPPESVEARRSPVAFPHALHFDYSCKTCHHMWENDDSLQGCMASGCHDLAESPRKAGGGAVDPREAVRYYKNAYHDACIGCHRQIEKENKKLAASGKVLSEQLPRTGPTGCHGCHPRE